MPDPNIKKVVMIVPGIRDYGTWIEAATQSFKEVDEENSLRVWPVRLGYFSVFKFLAPRPIIDYFVRNRVAILAEECKSAREEYPNAQLSFIGHSFGTHTITQFLKQHDSEVAEYVILCGSVVKRDYKFQEISERVGEPGKETKNYLYNDCGNADPWPTVGAKAGWIYGDIGTNGARGGLVTNRVFNGGHSFFNRKRYMKRYWANLIINGHDNQQQSPLQLREALAWYVKVLEKLPLNWIGTFLLMCSAILSYVTWAEPEPEPPTPEPNPIVIHINIDILRSAERSRKTEIQEHAKLREHPYQSWDEAFTGENKGLILDLKTAVLNDSEREVFFVAAPAAAGKGKLARLVSKTFGKNSIKVRYDRSLKDPPHSIPEAEYLRIPEVASWSFSLPKPEAPIELLDKLIREELNDKKLKPAEVKFLVIDGLDEIHPDVRKYLIQSVADGHKFVDETLNPNCVAFFARAEGFLEFEANNENRYPNVRARSLIRPIPAYEAEALAAWNDFEKWELRDDAGLLRDKDVTEKDVDRAKSVFLKTCKTNTLFRETISYVDMLNYAGFYLTKNKVTVFENEAFFAELTDKLQTRNKGTHGRPSNPTDDIYGEQYLKVLSAIAAQKSSEVNEQDGYFTVSNSETIEVRLSLRDEEGTSKDVVAKVNVGDFLRHSGFVELKPLTFNSPKFRFAPLWMHEYLASQFAEKYPNEVEIVRKKSE